MENEASCSGAKEFSQAYLKILSWQGSKVLGESHKRRWKLPEKINLVFWILTTDNNCPLLVSLTNTQAYKCWSINEFSRIDFKKMSIVLIVHVCVKDGDCLKNHWLLQASEMRSILPQKWMISSLTMILFNSW